MPADAEWLPVRYSPRAKPLAPQAGSIAHEERTRLMASLLSKLICFPCFLRWYIYSEYAYLYICEGIQWIKYLRENRMALAVCLVS